MSAYTPKARDDFPLLADFARRPSGWDSALIDRRREAGRALDEIDTLHREVHALKHGSRCPTDPEAALGYSVTPAESPAEAPEQRSPGRDPDELLGALSEALDEIWRLRLALAYEAGGIEAHLGYKTFPKTRRAIAEEQVKRMRLAVTRSELAYAGKSSQVMRSCAKECGFDHLTRYSWTQEMIKRARAAVETEETPT